MTRRWTSALAATALLAGSVLVSAPAQAASEPKLVSFDYGDWTKRTLLTDDFRISGSYHQIDVVAMAAFDKKSMHCKPFTLQLFRTSTGHQVGKTKHIGCESPTDNQNHAEAHWRDLPNAKYFILVDMKRKKGHTFGAAGTVIHGVKK